MTDLEFIKVAVSWMTARLELERDPAFAQQQMGQILSELDGDDRTQLLLHVSSMVVAALEQVERLTGVPPMAYLADVARVPYEQDK